MLPFSFRADFLNQSAVNTRTPSFEIGSAASYWPTADDDNDDTAIEPFQLRFLESCATFIQFEIYSVEHSQFGQYESISSSLQSWTILISNGRENTSMQLPL